MARKISIIFLLIFQIFFILLFANQKNVTLDEQYISALKLIGQGKYDEALSTLKEIIKKDITYFRAYRLIMRISTYKNELDPAKEFFDKLLQENKENSGAYFGLGLYYAEKEDFHQAAKNYYKAIELFPKSHLLFHYLISASKRSNQMNEAEKYTANIIKNEPDNAAALYGMGFLRFNQKKWD